jgi:Protein of unknown function (DUF3341)
MTRLYAEFSDPEALVRALAPARDVGAVPVEAYAPYPSHALERALGAPRSRLSIAVLAAGLGGAAGAYGLQWLLNAYLYPLDVGGRPAHFPLAFVPITFEMGVLFASLTAFLGVLVGGRLLRLWDPSRDVEGIESATATRCWLELETDASGPALESLTALLRDAGALAVRRAGGAG